MSDSIYAGGSVTAPGVGAAVATLAAPRKGVWKVKIDAGISGNAVADLGNLQVKKGAAVLVPQIPTGANGGSEEFVLDEVTFDGVTALTVNAIGAGTAAIEYNVAIEATPFISG